MKRLILPLVLLAALGLLGWAMASNPGQASADWLGWRIDTSAALVLVLGLLTVLAACALWTAALWLARIPRRRARARAEAQRGQVHDALTRGWLALAAGDPAEARRLAAQASGLDEAAVLPRLLAAQAAEAAGDDGAAQTLYAALLEAPEARAAARAGLSRLDARRAAPSPAELETAPPVAEAPLSLGT